jgi:ankyrin repeat protein
LLLNKNADTNAKYPEMMYTHEETALHLLIKNDTKLSNNELYDLAVLFLKKKFNINSTDDLQQTVLFLAVDRNDFKLVQLFLDNGADPNIKSGRRTPLKLAIKGKKDEKIIALLRQKGAKE